MGQSTNYSRVGHGTGRVEDTQRPSHEFQSGGRERAILWGLSKFLNQNAKTCAFWHAGGP